MSELSEDFRYKERRLMRLLREWGVMHTEDVLMAQPLTEDEQEQLAIYGGIAGPRGYGHVFWDLTNWGKMSRRNPDEGLDQETIDEEVEWVRAAVRLTDDRRVHYVHPLTGIVGCSGAKETPPGEDGDPVPYRTTCQKCRATAGWQEASVRWRRGPTDMEVDAAAEWVVDHRSAREE